MARSAVNAALAAAATLAVLVLLVGPGADPVSAKAPELTIELTTNNADADRAPGPTIKAGDAITWRYLITVNGPTTMYDAIVIDSSGATPSCDIDGDGGLDGTHIHPGPLKAGQSFTCVSTGIARPEGTVSRTASVRAFDFDGLARFDANDASFHTTPVPTPTTVAPPVTAAPTTAAPTTAAPITAAPTTAAPTTAAPTTATTTVTNPGLTIKALVNGNDGNSGPGPYVVEGSAVTWSYVVTNTGNVPLAGVTVDATHGAAVDCGNGTNVVPGNLASGEVAICSASTDADLFEAGLQATEATVSAAAVDPVSGATLTRLSARDSHNYTPVRLPGELAFTGTEGIIIPVGAGLVLVGLLLAVVGPRWVVGSSRAEDHAVVRR